MGFHKSWVKISYLQRYREVANILMKYGFGFIVEQINRRKGLLKKQFKSGGDEYQSLSRPQRLRMAFEELGPTYVKLGQLLSIRPDLLPPAYIHELEKLQDNVPPVSYEAIIKVCKQSGLDIERDFRTFEREPIAAASIAQVHRAVLNNGEQVVVKIQRPDIDRIIATDLAILKDISHLLERRTAWGELYRVTEIVDEFSDAIQAELDFQKEGRNADQFYKNFSRDRNIRIPKVFWEFTSQRVLVLEYLPGIKISDFSALKHTHQSTSKLASQLVDCLFKQIYEHGFFHADPHPGNIAVSEKNELIFYDFGQVGIIDNRLKELCMDLILSMIRYDVNGVTRSLLEIAISDHYVNREQLRRDVSRLQQKYYGMPMSQIKIGEAMAELLELSIKYQVRIPAELSLMVKMLMTMEGIISMLDPQLSIVDIAEPYGRRIMMKRYAPSNIAKNIGEIAVDYSRIVKELPENLEKISNLVTEGELKVKIEHSNINRLGSKIDIMSNRLSMAIIIASIVIGTSLVVGKIGNQFISRIPIVEIGFVTAMVLGLFLTYSILRSGKY